MKGQELLDQPGVRVDPPPREASREARVLVPKSRLATFEEEFHEITLHYPESECIHQARRIWEAWERFKGTRR